MNACQVCNHLSESTCICERCDIPAMEYVEPPKQVYDGLQIQCVKTGLNRTLGSFPGVKEQVAYALSLEHGCLHMEGDFLAYRMSDGQVMSMKPLTMEGSSGILDSLALRCLISIALDDDSPEWEHPQAHEIAATYL